MKGATFKKPASFTRGANNFNPRTHEGCDLLLDQIFFALCNKFQSTHPWRVRPVIILDDFKSFIISIHAPMKGATLLTAYRIGDFKMISIHAPMKGATFLVIRPLWMHINFNPRTHEGCDLWLWFYNNDECKISIHAPMKGATLARIGQDVMSGLISIHAPMKGATLIPLVTFCDNSFISIHAPMKGATIFRFKIYQRYRISIHAPMKGATKDYDVEIREV